ncbi:LysR family transcriptional regulator [Marinomonas shanghaiensis]|uniref:LysR family transcriptional regulator n=1 Tax=Marinomonas shanghaiensis TaxID=2202418 RepID=UPI003A8C89BA
MLDAVTLDQLRTFIAAAEEGSFSAAGRKIDRAQSVVSQTLANLELQLGVALFDRAGRYPKLTARGQALLRDAYAVADNMDGFKARASSLREGVESEISVAVDVMFPMDRLTLAVGYCRDAFPNTPLRMSVEILGGVIKPVLEGVCRVGIIGTLPSVPDELMSETLWDLPIVTLVSNTHPLATIQGVVTRDELAQQIQLILTDRSSLSESKNVGILSPLTWKLADLGAKYEFLKAGFGWGHMPLHMVEQDIVEGHLVKLQIAGNETQTTNLAMRIIYRKDNPPGPACRAFIDQLKNTEPVFAVEPA